LLLALQSLVVSTGNPLRCSTGNPPLWEWVFGTGIAYIIIGVLADVVGASMLLMEKATIRNSVAVFVVSGFLFAWMIVGAVSLWRDGGSCGALNYPVWAMGMADVIISIVLSVVGVGSTKVTVYG
jgi:hypothetical protein